MASDSSYFTIRLPNVVLSALEKLALSLNEKAGAKIWSRNKLILKAIQDYYFNELDLPVERRKLNLAVQKDRRNSSDRREKVPVTCSKVHTNIDPRQLLQDFEEIRTKKNNVG
jgi:hypothetical protein